MSTQTSTLENLSVETGLRQVAFSRTATFAAAIFLSAFLLFQVQPLIGKCILPWFGGTPAVWTTCMLFFQVTLFLGYAYAHTTTRWLSAKSQRAVHLALIAAALVVLPITPSAVWKPVGSEQPVFRILILLASTVGLAYFVLSSTGPLLQAWFSRVCPASSPYRLYALSNVGSLLALLSYPLVFEPLLPSPVQGNLWSALFLLFGLLCGACALWAGEHVPAAASRRHATIAGTPPALWQRILWLALPACSCLMLVAMTNQVTQNVAPMPFLWVAPLSLYLLSFIICFDHERWYRREVFGILTAVSLALISGLGADTDWIGLSLTTAQELVLYFVALFGVCMVCHGEVNRLKPSPKYLTEYYMLLSAGGALAGIFVSLIAPQIFTTYMEWSLGLLASFVIACIVTIVWLRSSTSHLQATASKPVWLPARSWLVAAVVAVELAVLVQIGFWEFAFEDDVYRGRNFYGTVIVNESKTESGEPYRSFLSGEINHGKQWLSSEKRRRPATYFGEGTAPALAIARIQSRPAARIGVVGLGIGTMATYARPGDSFRFYEINPEVEFIARKYFTYLEDCSGRCEVVLGDARLVLEREEAKQFDLLLLDAFTGDAPPVHLLTREAFRQYDRHVRSDGLLVVNVTNTYLELAPVVARLGRELGWKFVRIRTPSNGAQLAYRTDYLVFARHAALLPQSPTAETISDDVIRSAPVWTDQFSNLFQVLKRR